MGNSCLRHFLKLFRERNRIHRSIFVHVQECMQSRYMVYYISLILPKASFFLDYKIPSLYLHVNNFVFCRQIFFIIKVNSIEKLFYFGLCVREKVILLHFFLKYSLRKHIVWFVCQNQRNSQNANGCKISSYDCMRDLDMGI